jgi:hypothetical protein
LLTELEEKQVYTVKRRDRIRIPKEHCNINVKERDPWYYSDQDGLSR